MAWELRRQVQSDSNGYERNAHDAGGSAVLYEYASRRAIEVYVNGQRFEVPWPDTSALYGGDKGRPVNYRLRYEAGHWYAYAYVYSGGDNRSEWVVQIV